MDVKHFVLVHGACHGAWCWYKVATLLRSCGHKVRTLDLAASGIDQKLQVQDVNSWSVYIASLMDLMATIPDDEKVVLVGHSMGGVGLSMAMEKFPHKVSVAVFATAIMLTPDLDLHTILKEVRKNQGSFMDSQYRYDDKGLEKDPTSVLLGPKMLETNLYQLSPPEDLTLATMLVRPYPLNTDAKSLEETKVTKERFGSVHRVYVVADQDILLNHDMQRWIIELNPPDEVKVIKGSDHMIMFSKPKEFCNCLQEISQRYC